MLTRRVAVFPVLFVLSAALVGCSSDDTSSTTPSSTAPVTSTAPPTSSAPGGSTTVAPSTTTATTVAPTTAAPTVPPTTVAPTTVVATSIAPPPPGAPAIRLHRGNPQRATVALTFDAGADRGFTELILDTLRAEGIHASFGMTGRWAEANPDLLRRIVDEGHQLVNHSYSHGSATGVSAGKGPMSWDQRTTEIRRADETIVALVGVSPSPWYRPPYGDIDKPLDALLGELGYRYTAMWTVDSLGWRGLSAEEITSRCLDGASNGAIYLFHVGSQSQDAAALPGLIAALRARGLTPGSLLDVL